MFVLPSLSKNEIPSYQLLVTDWYLLFVISLMPTCFLGFLPDDLLYIPGFLDYRLLTFLLSLPLVFLGPRKTENRFGRIPGIWMLCAVASTVIIRTLWSLATGIPVSEVVAVLRWNFTWPIFSLCVLHYAARLPVERLYGVLRIFLVLFCVQVCLLTVSLITNVDFFLNKNAEEKSFQYVEQGLAVDNLRAFPVHIFVGTAFLALLVLRPNARWGYYVLLILSQALPLLLTRRMYTIILFMQTVSIILLVGLVAKNRKAFLLPLVIGLCAIVALFAIAGDRLTRWTEKVSPMFSDGIDSEEVGTYSFRQLLLKDADQSVKEDGSFSLGMGYTREYNILRGGGYSYVLGEDSFLASVVYCEGWGGVCVRILPYLALLLCNVKRLIWKASQEERMYSAAAVVVILVQVPAFLQTATICHYDYFYVPLALVELIMLKKASSSDEDGVVSVIR